jgi:hypothetical protein
LALIGNRAALQEKGPAVIQLAGIDYQDKIISDREEHSQKPQYFYRALEHATYYNDAGQ